MNVSRAGLVCGVRDLVMEGGGLSQSFVMLVGSTVPFSLEAGRVFLIREDEWISL